MNSKYYTRLLDDGEPPFWKKILMAKYGPKISSCVDISNMLGSRLNQFGERIRLELGNARNLKVIG